MGVTPDTPINPFLYLQRNADSDPRGIFSRDGNASVTNAEALVSVKKIAFEMRRLGVKPGHVVALQLPDQLGMLFTEAVYHEGAISTVLPSGFVADEGFIVDWIFASSPPLDQPGAVVVMVDPPFLRRVEENPYGISASDETPDTLRIVFSSGTTGIPNVIALGHRALQPFEDALDSWFAGDPFLVLMDMGTPWGFGGFYLSVKGARPFLCGGGASQETLVRIAAQNAITSLKGSPAQLAAFVAQLEAEGRTLPSVESIYFGGTVMPPGVAERLRAATGGCEIVSMYGATETGIVTSRTYEREDPSDAGQVLPDARVEVVDDEDKILPVGTPGRVRHRTPGMVGGYVGDPHGSSQAFRGGWFYPGDLGLIRPDGGLTLTGRESEVLNAGGVKIDPTRIDHFALGIAKVTDACSFEYASTSGIREIGIALVTDEDVDVDALVALLKAEFGPAAPKLVARVESIPRNVMGKPMRRTLADRYRED